MVVASVMCAGKDVDLPVLERPGLYNNIGSGPGTKSMEPGEGLYVPDLDSIVHNGFKGHSPESGDMSDLPVSVGIVVSGSGPPAPELGDTLGLPDFSSDIDPGPGESFPGSGSMLARPNVLDAYVPGPGMFLPESGGIPDGPGSANDFGSGSGKPFPSYGGALSKREYWNAIENEHEELPGESGDRLRQLDFTGGMDTENGVYWPGSDVLNILRYSLWSGPEFPDSGGIMKFPGVSDINDTGPGSVSPKAGV